MGETLTKTVDRLWREHSLKKPGQTDDWFRDLNGNLPKYEDAKKKIHHRYPYTFWLTVGGVKGGGRPRFSLRVGGWEVGSVKVKDGESFLEVTRDDLSKLREHLKVDVAPLESMVGQSIPWRAKGARRYRAVLETVSGVNVNTDAERAVQFEILKRMNPLRSGTIGKANAIVLAGAYFQMPLPISANNPDDAKVGNGNVDVLTNLRGGGQKTGIWEFKKPGCKPKSSLRQAYLYAATLRKMLRETKEQEGWWGFLGHKGAIPRTLRMEACAVVSESDADAVKREFKKHQDLLPQNVEGDVISCAVRVYGSKGKENVYLSEPVYFS